MAKETINNLILTIVWKLSYDEIKNNETEYYTNKHFIDHFRVNIDSKQSVVKEYPSNVPQIYHV